MPRPNQTPVFDPLSWHPDDGGEAREMSEETRRTPVIKDSEPAFVAASSASAMTPHLCIFRIYKRGTKKVTPDVEPIVSWSLAFATKHMASSHAAHIESLKRSMRGPPDVAWQPIAQASGCRVPNILYANQNIFTELRAKPEEAPRARPVRPSDPPRPRPAGREPHSADTWTPGSWSHDAPSRVQPLPTQWETERTPSPPASSALRPDRPGRVHHDPDRAAPSRSADRGSPGAKATRRGKGAQANKSQRTPTKPVRSGGHAAKAKRVTPRRKK